MPVGGINDYLKMGQQFVNQFTGGHGHGVGQPQPGYGAPQPSYGAPQPSYGAPQPGYGAQQPGYAAQQPGYAAQSGYGAPPTGYPAQSGYGAPPAGYPAQSTYGAPPPGYPAQPVGHYGAPSPQGYGAPAAQYGAPISQSNVWAAQGAAQVSEAHLAQELAALSALVTTAQQRTWANLGGEVVDIMSPSFLATAGSQGVAIAANSAVKAVKAKEQEVCRLLLQTRHRHLVTRGKKSLKLGNHDSIKTVGGWFDTIADALHLNPGFDLTSMFTAWQINGVRKGLSQLAANIAQLRSQVGSA